MCPILRWFGAEVGQGVLIRHRVTVQWPWKLSIGDNSWVGTGAELYNIDNIVIGSDVAFLSMRTYAREATTAGRRPSSSTTAR